MNSIGTMEMKKLVFCIVFANLAVSFVIVASGSLAQTAQKRPPTYKVTKTEAEWKKILTPAQYHILREQGTEPAFKNKYFDNHAKGIYLCAATRKPVFSSADKYDSHTGWPSFTKPISPAAVLFIEDNSHGMKRIEVVDALSGSHLGHVFNDGPAPTGKRFCMNSEALIFVPAKK